MKCEHNWEAWEGGKYDGWRWYRKCNKCGEMCVTNFEEGFPPDDVWEKM